MMSLVYRWFPTACSVSLALTYALSPGPVSAVALPIRMLGTVTEVDNALQNRFHVGDPVEF
jgi:hypothetical protein